MKFYAFRAVIVLFVTKLLTKIFFVEMPPIVSTTEIIKKEDVFLFVDLTYKKGLAFPGGIIQLGESVEEGLVREVKEEAGLDIVESTYLWSVATSTRGVGSLAMVFEVKVKGEAHGSEEGDLVWLTYDEALKKLTYRNNKIALKRYIESIQ